MKLKVLLIFFLTPAIVLAEIPDEVFTINTILSVIRNDLQQKILQLGKSYNAILQTDRVVYTSENDETCPNNIKVKAKQQLAALTRKVTKDYNKEKGYYTLSDSLNIIGCTQEAVFQENLLIQSTVPKDEQDFTEIREGLRELHFDPDTLFLSYNLADGRGNSLFRIIQKRSTDRNTSFVTVRVADSDVFNFKYLYKPNTTTLIFQTMSYNIQGYFFGNGIGHSRTQDLLQVKARFHKSGGQEYLDNDNNWISLNDFQRKFNNRFIKRSADIAARIVSFGIEFLPNTKVFSAGLKNSRFLDELRDAQAQITNNPTRVQKQITDYIRLIEQNVIQIIDNRKE